MDVMAAGLSRAWLLGLMAGLLSGCSAIDALQPPAVVVGAAYHHEPSRVIAVLEEVAHQHVKVLQYPPPQAFTVDFADSSINYKLLFWVRNPLEAFAVGRDLRQAIWTAFDKHGIGIPFPQRQVYPMECPPPRNKPTGSAAPAISSRPKQTAIQPTTQLARRRR